jgi:hypothetical protein
MKYEVRDKKTNTKDEVRGTMAYFKLRTSNLK